jgi:serralysin
MTLLATASVTAFAAPAQAATTGTASVVETTKVQYKAAKGKQNKVVVTRSGNTITIDDKHTIKAGKGCKTVKGDKTKVRCTTKKTPTRVRVYTYDRNDTVVNNTDLGMTADGGTGKDKLTGGPRGDLLRGDRGADTIRGLGGKDTIDGSYDNDYLSGGDGADHIEDGFGKDVVHGDNDDDDIWADHGNDKYYGDAGNDTFDFDQPVGDGYRTDADRISGGSGSDTAMYIYWGANVSVDLDGVTGDDGMKGEHDTVGKDVENLVGGLGNDRLVGNAGDNAIYGTEGKDVISGLGGDDHLEGQQGADKLYGGAGDDWLDGRDFDNKDRTADLLNAGAGDDGCNRKAKDTAKGCETFDNIP